MKDETPSQYPKQVPMAVPMRVPSRCGVKALLRLRDLWSQPSPGPFLQGLLLPHLAFIALGSFQPPPATRLPKACALLTIMVSEVFIPCRRMATSVKTSMSGP